MGKKSFLIVSNFFYPEVTPRAFRTTELTKELCRQGNRVTLVLPNKQAYQLSPLKIDGAEIIFADSPLQVEGQLTAKKRAKSIMPKWLLKCVLYLYNHEYFEKYDKGITRRLMELDDEFDAMISISYPAAIHRSSLYAVRHNPNLRIKIKLAEFSDPPLRNELSQNIFPAYKLFMHRLGRHFDHFIIPVANALPCYTEYKAFNQIAVIPQGFDLQHNDTHKYTPNKVPTFAYAGRFYQETRDPKFLFEYLTNIDFDFLFELYLLNPEPYFDEMFEQYRAKIKGRIIIHKAVPREILIERLSKMDFIVNFEFTYTTATASKLIDYILAGRPTISFSSLTFDPNRFDCFLKGDYSNAMSLPDASDYDIRNVVSKFEKVIDSTIR